MPLNQTSAGLFRLSCRAGWQKGFWYLVCGLLFTLPVCVSAATSISYNRDVRPILAENCFPCHGPDSASRKATLRLDHFDDAIAPRKDKPAIVPGKPDASAVIERINVPDPDDIMPPAKSGKKLTAQQKNILQHWIHSGAQYEPLWSFIAPVRPVLPKASNRRWVRTPIDNFILARLDEKHLKPAAEADRRTLIRRVSLDLTGLPPTPAEVESFVKDASADAYEKVVDRLLASPQYGEHRARYWLDAARYADSNGIHYDNYREMWSYRDWVIKAFNDNKSFADFTIEQLAGDLLPNHTIEQEVASGFNRCNMTTSEGGAIDEEYLVLYARDRTETTSQVWLGLTAGCAVCHDHKFDPLPQKQFYALSAFFNNTTQKAMDGNVKDTPPVIVVPTAADRARWLLLIGEKQAAEKTVTNRRNAAHDEFTTWLADHHSTDAFAKHLPRDEPAVLASLADDQPQSIQIKVHGESCTVDLGTNIDWQPGFVAAKAFTTSQHTTPVISDLGDYEKDQSFSYGAWVYLTGSRDGAIFSRMDDQHGFRGWDLWLQGGKPAAHIINAWPDDALKVAADKAIETNKWTHLFVTYDGSAKPAGLKIYINGELQKTTVESDTLKSSIRTKSPFKIGQRNTTSPVDGASLQDLRIYERALSADEVQSIGRDTRLDWLLAQDPKKFSDKEKAELYDGWLKEIDLEYLTDASALKALEKVEMGIRERGTEALVMHERNDPAAAYVLFRGDYEQRRDKVEPNVPTALPPMPADFPRNRLGFARWLLLPENPLTARVTVNRFWQEIFGAGIVRTAGDFGVTGEMPSHPELLDWLAVEFRESGWDMKKMFKLMVMSAAYRQAAIVTPDKLTADMDNRLLSRGARFRMDAEMVRDYALAASGLLVPKIGGPSVKPYQPPGVWESVGMPESDTRHYERDSGEKLYRRSIYTFWKRGAPPASLEIFNAPNRESCTVWRERGDTPLQALVTMNDPQFVEAARHLAQLALEQNGANENACLDFMARRLLARPLRSEESRITKSTYEKLLAYYRITPADAEALLAVGESKTDGSLDKPTLAAYTMVANQLMNLDEVLNK